MEKIKVLDVPINMTTMDEAVATIDGYIKEGGFHTVFTPNPEILMAAKEDESLKEILCEADLVVPDGIGVVIASRILKTPNLPERVPGYDLIQNTMKVASKKGYKYYFLGGKPGVAQKAKEKMCELHKGIDIVGYHDGYFKEEDIPAIIEDINTSQANILLVCLGAPKQEQWISRYKEALTHVNVAVGAGGSLDGMAGIVQRAPLFFQRIGLEWFYRLIKQPSRWKRMLVLPVFLIEIIKKR